MKKILGFFVVVFAMLAFNAAFAQSANTGSTTEAKPACHNKSAACCKDKKGTANAEQSSAKMVEAGGVAPEGKPACANKSAACCKDKKGTANAEQSSAKMVEAGGVAPEGKPACANKSAACCKDKKTAASCDKEKKAETTTPQE